MTTAASSDQPRASTTSSRAENLWLKVLLLAAPVCIEQLLHSIVGFTDTYLANNLSLTDPAANRNPAAAVGSVAYIIWFVGLLAGTVGIGATALISRATGARHQSLARAACGQAILGATCIGVVFAVVAWVVAPVVAPLVQLPPEAQDYFVRYLRIVAPALPLAILMFACGSCLRGAGDTIWPAVAFVTVDIVNAVFSFGLVRGWGPLPELGFDGIAIGTALAYATGGVMLIAILLSGRGKLRLVPHRLWPDVDVLKRIFRVGLPAGAEQSAQWTANFAVVGVVNTLGATAATAHLNAIRLEAFSYLLGMGFAVAGATLVGQSLGMGDPLRARRCAYRAFVLGGGLMTTWGLVFLLLGPSIARLVSDDPEVIRLTGRCLQIAGFCQTGFAAALVFGFALRGAGDTTAVMRLNLASIIGLRLVGTIIIVKVFGFGLNAIWVVLCSELIVRGTLMFLRFRFGSWASRKV